MGGKEEGGVSLLVCLFKVEKRETSIAGKG